jgi:hypothetical protein
MFHPSLVWVDVTAVSPAPQVGWTATQDGNAWTFAAPAAFTPTPQQQAVALLTNGAVAITSTATPALNGSYAIDPISRGNIIAVQTSINAGLGVPGGGPTFNYLDASNAPHAFTAANFTAFATAVRDYVYALTQVASGAVPDLPTTPITIA